MTMTVRDELERAIGAALISSNRRAVPRQDLEYSVRVCNEFLRDHGPDLLEAVRDAERYRWLRDINNRVEVAVLDRVWEDVYVKDGEKLDASIDAAREGDEG